MKHFLSTLLCLLPLLGFAQVYLRSEDDALALARKNNPDLQIALQGISVEKEMQKSTTARLMPQLKAVSNLEYHFALPVQLVPAEFLGGREGDFKQLQFGTTYSWSAGLEASIPLLNPTLWAETRAASLKVEAAREGYRHKELQALQQVSRGYYLALLAKGSLMISEENARNADSLLSLAGTRKVAGLLDPLEYNRITINRARAQNELTRNQAVLQNNLNALKLLLGIPPQDSLVLPVPNLSLNELSEVPQPSLQQTGAAVREQELLLEAALWRLRKEQYRRLPEISLYSRYLKQAQRNKADFFDNNKDWFDIGLAGIRMELPLFNGFARNSATRQMKQRYNLQEIALKKELALQQHEGLSLHINYTARLAAVKQLKESFGLGEQNIKMALLRYREGLYSLDQYLNVQNEQLSLQNQYLTALAKLYTTHSLISLKQQ